MKKKIILLLIFIVSFMEFGIEVKASRDRPRCDVGIHKDYSLNYDIEKMEVVDKKLHISGWVVKHNCDTYGGENFSVSFRFVNGTNIVGVDSNGEILKDFKVNFYNRSLTYAYCYKDASKNCTNTKYIYDSVGFDIYIPLDEYLSQLSNNEWSLKIYSKFMYYDSSGNQKSIIDEEDLAVYEENVDINSFENSSFKLTGIGSTVDIIGNHVKYNGEDYYYWKLTAGMNGIKRYEVAGKEWSSTYGIYRYKLKNGGASSAKSYGFDNCGFDYANEVGLYKKKCIGPGEEIETYILSTFVKPYGVIKFKYTGGDTLPDKVCTIGNDKIDSCESKNLLYNCNEMKIRTKSDNGTILAAYVKLKEYGRFSMTSYAGENVKVLAGQGFPIGMSYIYNLSWEMSDFVCNGVADITCYQKLYKKLYDLSFKDVSDGNLQLKLNTSGVSENEINKFKDETDENLSIAGSWECNGGLNDYSEGETSGGATIICQYKINDAYIKFDTGYITYKDKSSENRFKNLGAYFYIPLNYSDSTFYWDVISDNISLVKVRTMENNYDFVENNGWYINTKDNVDDSGNNQSKCFVEVKKGSIGPPGSGSDDGINIVYRSVDTDISNDESTLDSNLKLYYLEEGTNWYNYFYDVNDDGTKSLNRSHFSRIKTTFDNLHYSTKTLTNSKINSLLKDFDSENYTNWNNVDSNGISGLISSDYFNVINTGGKIHCKWGEFNKLTCDDYNT